MPRSASQCGQRICFNSARARMSTGIATTQRIRSSYSTIVELDSACVSGWRSTLSVPHSAAPSATSQTAACLCVGDADVLPEGTPQDSTESACGTQSGTTVLPRFSSVHFCDRIAGQLDSSSSYSAKRRIEMSTAEAVLDQPQSTGPVEKRQVINDFSIQVATANGSGS